MCLNQNLKKSKTLGLVQLGTFSKRDKFKGKIRSLSRLERGIGVVKLRTGQLTGKVH